MGVTDVFVESLIVTSKVRANYLLRRAIPVQKVTDLTSCINFVCEHSLSVFVIFEPKETNRSRLCPVRCA